MAILFQWLCRRPPGFDPLQLVDKGNGIWFRLFCSISPCLCPVRPLSREDARPTPDEHRDPVIGVDYRQWDQIHNLIEGHFRPCQSKDDHRHEAKRVDEQKGWTKAVCDPNYPGKVKEGKEEGEEDDEGHDPKA